MSVERSGGRRTGETSESSGAVHERPSPGKRALTDAIGSSALDADDSAAIGPHPLAAPFAAMPVQARVVDAFDFEYAAASGDAHALAHAGTQGAAAPLPHLAQIQESFGRHDVSGVSAHLDGGAAASATAMGAAAYAHGEHVAFANTPTLHTAAHEAAHVVQQRSGGVGVATRGAVGQVGDAWETHADAVADRVVAGRSAEDLLDAAPAGSPPVQRQQGEAQARQSRVTVASSVQANRPTYPDDRSGGRLTSALVTELGRRRTSVADAAERAGAGTHRFGQPGRSGEEREGMSVGHTAAPSGEVTRRAVVIGNADYNAGTTMGATVEPSRDLPAVTADTARVPPRLRGYQITSLANQTGAQIAAAVQAGLAGLTAGSELVFFYNGHGTIEGLIGVDGQVFTPAQAGACRDAARAAQVDFTMILEGCHTGIFVDFIRGRELADTRAAAQAQQRADAPASPAARNDAALVAMLDSAIAAQQARDRYNTSMQGWWARRFEVEQAMSAALTAGTPQDQALAPWEAHLILRTGHFNTLATAANPHLTALPARAQALNRTVRALQLRAVAARADQTVDDDIQGQLDDMDQVLNEVLRLADDELAREP